MIKYIMDTIENLKKEEKKQQIMHTQKLESTKDDCNNSITNGKYCITMNNYSTLPNIMPLLCKKVIEVFGTSQFKKNGFPIISMILKLANLISMIFII